MNQNLRNYVLQLASVADQTPFYVYDLDLLRRTLKAIQEESNHFGYKVHYALKANANDRLLQEILPYIDGADCVSGNEVAKAIATGFEAKKVVFAGVGKSDHEIDLALKHDIFCFNCESSQELMVINERAKFQNKTANIALRINPGVNANTHHYITTGLEENKFGINPWELQSIVDLLPNLKYLKLIGLHFHIGSQITDLQPFKSLCLKVNEISDWFATRNIYPSHLNVGGGLGVDYHQPDDNEIPYFHTYFKVFHDFLNLRPDQTLHFELGRAVVAQCGSLISKVLYIKEGVKTSFVILDAGMTELIRPALYQAFHKLENLSKFNQKNLAIYDIVGPICESSDTFGKAIALPPTSRGDIVAIRSAGAYGEVMASTYNLRSKAQAFYFESNLADASFN